MKGTPIKISFPLQPDVDGYPPVSAESLWAKEVGSGYVIDSIPFFTAEATVGDLIRAEKDEGGALWFESVEQPSRHSLVRAVFFDASREQSIVARLRALGCATESMKAFKLLAVDVPSDLSLPEVQEILRDEATAGHLDYEEPLLRH